MDENFSRQRCLDPDPYPEKIMDPVCPERLDPDPVCVRGWIRFVPRGLIWIRSISDLIRNPAYQRNQPKIKMISDHES